MAIKKLKYKDIYTAEMGDPPENNDMGSATKPSKQDMGAGAGRGKQGGPTAKELADYSRKQERKRSGDRVFMAEDGQPPENNDMGPKKYAKGGMASSASSRGNGIAVRGKTKGRLC